MMESSFQFSTPVLTSIEYHINEKENNDEKIEYHSIINFAVQCQRDENSNEALVKLIFTIGEKKEECPFYIKATEEAHFRWDDTLDEAVIEDLLNQNAPSLLLSYLRPIIVQITSASPFNTFNIPFMNFTKPHQL